MADTTTFIVDLFVLLASAVLAGELANRLGQVALVGQLLVGVVLGPTLFGSYLGLTGLGPALAAIQLLATVFILFMAGLDVIPEQIYRMGPQTIGMGVAVFAIPFALLSLLAKLLLPAGSGLLPLFVGLTLSITALPVMGIMLKEFGLLKSRVGNLLINTALVNELSAVTTFAILLELRSGSGSTVVDVALASLAVGVFVGTMFGIHTALQALRATPWWDRARGWFAATWRSKESGFALLMVGIIGASLFSQFMGLTFVVGAFYAGILVTEQSAGVEAHRTISNVFDAMTWGFFIPLFFAFVGVQMNLRLLNSVFWVGLFGILLAAAIVTKIATGFSVARFFGWPRYDALAIGHLVNSRGAVELAMAVVLLTAGVFTTQLFTLVAAVGLVTTFMAPIGASAAWRAAGDASAAASERESPPPEPPSDFPISPTLSFQSLRERYLGPAGRPEVRPPPEVPGGFGPSAPPPRAPPPGARPPPSGPPPLPTRRAKGPPPSSADNAADHS